MKTLFTLVLAVCSTAAFAAPSVYGKALQRTRSVVQQSEQSRASADLPEAAPKAQVSAENGFVEVAATRFFWSNPKGCLSIAQQGKNAKLTVTQSPAKKTPGYIQFGYLVNKGLPQGNYTIHAEITADAATEIRYLTEIPGMKHLVLRKANLEAGKAYTISYSFGIDESCAGKMIRVLSLFLGNAAEGTVFDVKNFSVKKEIPAGNQVNIVCKPFFWSNPRNAFSLQQSARSMTAEVKTPAFKNDYAYFQMGFVSGKGLPAGTYLIQSELISSADLEILAASEVPGKKMFAHKKFQLKANVPQEITLTVTVPDEFAGVFTRVLSIYFGKAGVGEKLTAAQVKIYNAQ